MLASSLGLHGFKVLLEEGTETRTEEKPLLLPLRALLMAYITPLLFANCLHHPLHLDLTSCITPLHASLCLLMLLACPSVLTHVACIALLACLHCPACVPHGLDQERIWTRPQSLLNHLAYYITPLHACSHAVWLKAVWTQHRGRSSPPRALPNQPFLTRIACISTLCLQMLFAPPALVFPHAVWFEKGH